MSEFAIEVRENNAINVVSLKGYLDAHTAPKLEETFQTLLNGQTV